MSLLLAIQARRASDTLGTSDSAGAIRGRSAGDRLATRDSERNLAIYQGFEGGFLPSVSGGGIANPTSPNVSVAAAGSSDALTGAASLQLTLTISSGTHALVALNHFGTNAQLSASDGRNARVGAGQFSRGWFAAKVVSATGGTVDLLDWASIGYDASGSELGSSGNAVASPAVGTWLSNQTGGASTDIFGPTLAFASPGVALDWSVGTTQIVVRIDSLAWQEDVGGVNTFFDGSYPNARWEGATGLGPSVIETGAVRTATTRPRSAPDALGTSDLATRVDRSLGRTAPDTLGTSDAATHGPLSLPRTGQARLGTDDVYTNLVANPSYETGAGGASGLGNSVTIAQVSDSGGGAGSSCLEVTLSGLSGTGPFYFALNHYGGADATHLDPSDARNIAKFASPAVCTLSAATKVVSATGGLVSSLTIGLAEYDPADGHLVGTPSGSFFRSFPGTGVWSGLTAGSLAAPTGSGFISPAIGVTVGAGTTSVVVRIDAALLRLSPGQVTASPSGYAPVPSYFDGSSAGSYWLGTANASASSKTLVSRIDGSLGRTGADSLATTDAAARTLSNPRTAPDTLGTTDSATRFGALPRIAADYAGAFNLVPDPSFEGANVSQWTSSGPTLTQDTAHATSRSHTLRSQGTSFGSADITFPVTRGQRYMFRATVFVAAVGAAQGATLTLNGGLGGLASTPAGSTGAFSLVNQTAPATGSSATLSLDRNGAGTFDFYWDSVALVPISANTQTYPFFDGGTGEWLGTPEASMSRFSDAATRAAQSLPRSGSDSLGTTDAAAPRVALPRTAPDTLGTTDSAAGTATGTPGRTASDSLGTTDSATRGAQSFARSAADSLATSDAATRSAPRARTSADSLGTADAASRSAQAFSRSGADSLATTDLATRGALLRVRTATDALATTDAASRAPQAFARSATDALATTDLATRAVGRLRNAPDALGTTDSATRATQLFARAGADALGTSDAATRSANRTRTSTDSLGTTDAATRTLAHPRSAADSLGTADAATRAVQHFNRSGADALGTSDLASVPQGGRSATDSLGTTDQATRQLAHPRSSADALATSDAAARAAQSLARAGADALATLDAATRAYQAIRFGSDAATLTDAAARGEAVAGRLALDALLTDDAAAREALLARLALDALLTSDFVLSAPPPETYISEGHASPLYAAEGSAVLAEARGFATPTIIPMPVVDYQVFQVTDLVIPAGTDWSAHGGPSLGSFVVTPHNMVQAKLSIEFAPGNRAQLTDSQDQIILYVDETGDYATSEGGWYLSGNSAGAGGNGGRGVKGEIVWSTAVDGLDPNDQVPDILPSLLRGFGSDPIPDPYTLHVYLRTSGPTQHEAHIVRARAAFLVI